MNTVNYFAGIDNPSWGIRSEWNDKAFKWDLFITGFNTRKEAIDYAKTHNHPISNEFDHHLSNAQDNEPDGLICGFCGEENDFADDCGFFYIVPLNYSTLTQEEKRQSKSLPACTKCYFGEPGRNHTKIFGVGER